MTSSYLNIVVHGQVAHGLCIRIPVLAVGLQGRAQLTGMLLQHGVQHQAVLHSTIHTLHNRVGRFVNLDLLTAWGARSGYHIVLPKYDFLSIFS